MALAVITQQKVNPQHSTFPIQLVPFFSPFVLDRFLSESLVVRAHLALAFVATIAALDGTVASLLVSLAAAHAAIGRAFRAIGWAFALKTQRICNKRLEDLI